MPFYPSSSWLWPFVVIFSYFSAFIAPTSTTLVSNSVLLQIQGEALGILGSVITAAYAFSALSAGIFVGLFVVLPMWIGGSIMFLSSFILLAVFRKRLFQFP